MVKLPDEVSADHHADRLAMARRQGAECVDFDREDPVQTIVEMTGGIGVDRAIDAVGLDAEHAHGGPAAQQAGQQAAEFERELREVAPEQHPHDGQWQPGDAPSQALQWAVEAPAKAGTLSIIGVYPPSMKAFPIGEAMNKNLTIRTQRQAGCATVPASSCPCATSRVWPSGSRSNAQ